MVTSPEDAARIGSPPSDEDLGRLAQTGQLVSAWKEVCRRLTPALAWLVVTVLRACGLGKACRPDAEQQAALALREALSAYDLSQAEGPEACRFRMFAYAIVRRRLLDYARSVQRHERHYDRRQDAEAADDACGDRRRPVAEMDPAMLAENRETHERLRQAVAGLPERPRRIVIARCFEDKTQEAVALELGLSRAKVIRLEQAALAQLRRKLRNLAD